MKKTNYFKKWPLYIVFFLIFTGTTVPIFGQLFQTSFTGGNGDECNQDEFNCVIEVGPQRDDIVGTDPVSGQNWDVLENHENIGNFHIQYRQDNLNDMKAEIVNGSLEFRVTNSSSIDNGQGRVQANLYCQSQECEQNNGLQRFRYSVQLFIPDDFNWMLHEDNIFEEWDWLTLMEFWNNAGWTGEPFPFRMSINLRKNAGETRFHLNAKAEQGVNGDWADDTGFNVDSDDCFDIPTEEWLTFEIFFVEGNAETGRFVLNLTTGDGVTRNIFNITDFTHHPEATSPDGIKHINPMKLYTGDELIDDGDSDVENENSFQSNGQTFHVFWDNFTFFDDFLDTDINTPFSLNITNPSQNNQYFELGTIPLTAEVIEAENDISVEFLVNGECPQTASGSSPEFVADWSPPSNGLYEITALVTDGNDLNPCADVSINVGCLQVSTGNDDADNDELDNDELELSDVMVGLRFNDVEIPKGAIITEAYIQFTASGKKTGSPSLEIYGELTSNSQDFTVLEVDDRDFTEAFEDWEDIPYWNFDGESDLAQRTPDLSNIIQEIITETDFVSGNSLAIIFDEGDGKRKAYSFEGDLALAPILCINYICPRISGAITTPGNVPIPNVDVLIHTIEEDPCGIGNYDTFIDDINPGLYRKMVCDEPAELSCESAGGIDYLIKPEKNSLIPSDYLCGISTFDLVLLSQHILGIQALTDPYKLIAADVNNSGTITSSDITEIRKLILFIDDELPNNTPTWRFIAADYEFPDPTNPFLETLPESVTANNGNECITQDFYGIKMGDINCSCENEFSMGIIPLKVNGGPINKGDVIDLTFTFENYNAFIAYQLGLKFQPDKLKYIKTEEKDIIGAAAIKNFGLKAIEQGVIRTLWTGSPNSPAQLTSSPSIFKMSFEALENFNSIKEVLVLDNNLLSNRLYDTDGKAYKIQLVYGDKGSGPPKGGKLKPISNNPNDWLSQVECYPNPASHETNFKIDLAKNASVKIQIIDALNRTLIHKEMDLTTGQHTIQFDQLDTWSNGLYFYSVQINDSNFTGKFIKTDY